MKQSEYESSNRNRGVTAAMSDLLPLLVTSQTPNR